MEDAVIVEAIRSPIGRARKGHLVNERADEVGGFIVDALMKRVPALPRSDVEDLMVGCGVPEGEQGYNIARVIALISGLGVNVPGTTVSRYCASSLQTIRMAAHAIWAGEGDVFVAAGVEFVSRYPKLDDHRNPRFLPEDAPQVYISMGLTAENVARQYGVSREDQDAFAARSQDRTRQSRASGFWTREIVPVPLADGTVMTEDDSPRPGTTIQRARITGGHRTSFRNAGFNCDSPSKGVSARGFLSPNPLYRVSQHRIDMVSFERAGRDLFVHCAIPPWSPIFSTKASVRGGLR